MASIHSFIHPYHDEVDEECLSGVEIEKALALTLPKPWFLPYFKMPRQTSCTLNCRSNLFRLIAYYFSKESEAARTSTVCRERRSKEKQHVSAPIMEPPATPLNEKKRKKRSKVGVENVIDLTTDTLEEKPEYRISIFDRLALGIVNSGDSTREKTGATRKRARKSKTSRGSVEEVATTLKKKPPMKFSETKEDDSETKKKAPTINVERLAHDDDGYFSGIPDEQVFQMARISREYHNFLVEDNWKMARITAMMRYRSLYDVVLRTIYTCATCERRTLGLLVNEGLWVCNPKEMGDVMVSFSYHIANAVATYFSLYHLPTRSRLTYSGV